jgi:uroporphyrinogen decarboxylase
MAASTERSTHSSLALSQKELFLRACRCQPVPRVPVWMMRQAGRYLPEYREIRKKHTFLEVCKTPELAAEVSLQPYRRLGVDAVIVFSDILIPAEAMGMRLAISDVGPQLPEPIRTAGQVQALREFDPEQGTRFLMDTIRALCRTLGASVPVLGFAAAPWTLACYLIEGATRQDFASARCFLREQPEALRMLLEKIARSTAGYLSAQVAAGAAAVQLFDTWAGELSLSDYLNFALLPTRWIVEALAKISVPVILYTKASNHLMPEITRTKASVLSVDWRVPLRELRAVLGPGIAIQGNVDPAILLGSPGAVRRAARDTVCQLALRGHILNLGHGILPDTPAENARMFVETGQSTVFRTDQAALAVSQERRE